MKNRTIIAGSIVVAIVLGGAAVGLAYVATSHHSAPTSSAAAVAPTAAAGSSSTPRRADRELAGDVASGLTVRVVSDVEDGLKVGDLARASGLSIRTVRYSDQIGLLTPSRRSPAGHRQPWLIG